VFRAAKRDEVHRQSSCWILSDARPSLTELTNVFHFRFKVDSVSPRRGNPLSGRTLTTCSSAVQTVDVDNNATVTMIIMSPRPRPETFPRASHRLTRHTETTRTPISRRTWFDRFNPILNTITRLVRARVNPGP